MMHKPQAFRTRAAFVAELSPQHSRCVSFGENAVPDVLERQELSLNLLSKRVMSLILEKHLVVLEYYLASLKNLEYF